MAAPIAEAGSLFSFAVPIKGTPAQSDAVRACFEGIARTNYTTDPSKPANPRYGMLRMLATNPNAIKLQTFVGTWQDIATLGVVVIADDFLTTAQDFTLASVRNVAVNASIGNRIANLPTAASARGRTYFIKKIDATTHTVTITPAGGDTIEGAATLVLSKQNQYAVIISNGANQWWVYSATPVASRLQVDPLITPTDGQTVFNLAFPPSDVNTIALEINSGIYRAQAGRFTVSGPTNQVVTWLNLGFTITALDKIIPTYQVQG